MDWTRVSERLEEMESASGLGSMREIVALRKLIAAMSSGEILAALEEISTLGLDEQARSSLEEMLVESLIEKDPEAALKQFANRIVDEDDGMGWQLPEAFEAWIKKDLAAASEWYERQIATGLFESKLLDGQSQARMEFEAALVKGMLDAGMSDAAQRIAALPEDQRREGLEQISFAELSPAGQRAYTELVWGLVPEDKSGNDDLLVAFLDNSPADSNLKQALPLVEQIADPKRREEILKEFE